MTFFELPMLFTAEQDDFSPVENGVTSTDDEQGQLF